MHSTRGEIVYSVETLGHLGTNQSGSTYGEGRDVNMTGVAIGWTNKYSGNVQIGIRAVVWHAGSTVPVELATLGTNSSGTTFTRVDAINASGVMVGSSTRYSGDASLGGRPVLWQTEGAVPIELGTLGTNLSGFTSGLVHSINNSGDAVGDVGTYSGNTFLGNRAVRWAAGGTSATQLQDLGTSTTGVTNAQAWQINDSGVIAGVADKYSGTTLLGSRAVVWAAGGTAVTELGHIGTDAAGVTNANASAINSAGEIVGQAEKYAGNTSLNRRAVRWAAGGTVALELGNLGLDSLGRTNAAVYGINDLGDGVGYAQRYQGSTYLGDRAALWAGGGTAAVDLNDLIDPTSGWVLNYAMEINEKGTIVGIGRYDPDGAGGLPANTLPFRLVAVPEPGGLALGVIISTGFVHVASRRMRRRRR